MTDTLNPKERSERMSRVRNKDTKPEMRLRRFVHSLGYRYRLHDSKLPGTPDLVFRSREAVIFMHGCFWHRHENCKLARMPKSRLAFWHEKLEKNKHRDIVNQHKLHEMGWRVLVVWECQLEDVESLASTVSAFLDGSKGRNA